MSDAIAYITSSLIFLLGLVLVVFCNSRLRRPGGTVSLAVWFIMPGLLVMQSVAGLLAAPSASEQQLGEACVPLSFAVALCAASLVAVARLAGRISIKGRRPRAALAFGLLGLGAVVAQVVFGVIAPVALVAVFIGLVALHLAPSEGRAPEDMPLSHAAGVLWSIMLIALAAWAPLAHASELVAMLDKVGVWPSAEETRAADAMLGRTLIISSLAGLSAVSVLVASLGRVSLALRRDRAAQLCGGLLLIAGLLGLGALQRADAASRQIARLAQLPRVPSMLPLPSTLDSAMPAGVPQGYAESSRTRRWYDERRCAAVLEGGAWRFSPLVDGASCEAAPEPLILLPGAARAEDAARAIARSAYKPGLTTLAPLATRYLPLSGAQRLPYIMLGWKRLDAWRSWSPSYVMLVRRGERSYLFCSRAKRDYPEGQRWAKERAEAREREHDALYGDEGARMELDAWKERVREWESGGDGWSPEYDMVEPRRVELGARMEGWRAEAAPCGAQIAITIAPGEQTVQDVVDACAALQDKEYGCAVIDALPEEVARQLAALEGAR